MLNVDITLESTQKGMYTARCPALGLEETAARSAVAVSRIKRLRTAILQAALREAEGDEKEDIPELKEALLDELRAEEDRAWDAECKKLRRQSGADREVRRALTLLAKGVKERSIDEITTKLRELLESVEIHKESGK
jgi:hypothetical protein